MIRRGTETYAPIGTTENAVALCWSFSTSDGQEYPENRPFLFVSREHAGVRTDGQSTPDVIVAFL